MKAQDLAVVAAIALLLSACASSPPPAPIEFYIGQVIYVATAEEASHGFHYTASADEALHGFVPDSLDVPPATGLINSCAYDGSPDTRFAVVRFYYYWLNAPVRIVTLNRWSMVDKGLSVQRGNIVELTVHSTSASSRCAVVAKLRAANLGEAHCEYRVNQKGWVENALAAFSTAGGPGAASLYCPFLETEGWNRVPDGGYGGFLWSKTPP
jgi:hypothetical protein